MRRLCDRLVESCRLLEYPVAVFDLGGLGYGTPMKPRDGDLRREKGFISCVFKVEALRQAPKTGDHLVWLDADCLVKERFDEALTGDYDIAVTEREPWEIERFGSDPRVGSVNSGVLFLRNSGRLNEFLDRWEQLAVLHRSEQRALNEISESGMFHVKRLPCASYNNYYFRTGDNPKIVHYKGTYQNPWIDS